MPENLDPNTLLQEYVIPWGINIALALAVFIVGRWVAKGIVALITRLLTRAKLDHILVQFVGSILRTVLLLIVVVAALDQLGVDTTSLIALMGAAGLAVGEPLTGESIGIALCKTQTELLEKINAGLAAVMAEGLIDSLNAKWVATADLGE